MKCLLKSARVAQYEVWLNGRENPLNIFSFFVRRTVHNEKANRYLLIANFYPHGGLSKHPLHHYPALVKSFPQISLNPCYSVILSKCKRLQALGQASGFSTVGLRTNSEAIITQRNEQVNKKFITIQDYTDCIHHCDDIFCWLKAECQPLSCSENSCLK